MMYGHKAPDLISRIFTILVQQDKVATGADQ